MRAPVPIAVALLFGCAAGVTLPPDGAVTVTPPATTLERLRTLSTRRLYFQHASVGGESVGVYDAQGFTAPWGLLKLIADNPGSGFSVARDAASAADIQAGQLGEWSHGSLNGNPTQKLALFDQRIRGGLGGAVNVAVFKLGTPDIDQGNGTISETAQIPQTTWFNTVYKPTMDALAALYPGTTFVHATVPIHSAGAYWGNVHYEQWNNLLRANYPGRLFDLAKWESVNASGQRAQSADGAPCIHADWQISGDAHVNQEGANWLGQHLLELLASIP